MELKSFMRELESALIERGIPSETAKKHVFTLQRTFTTDDLNEIDAIKSSEEVEQLAESISVILNKNRTASNKNLVPHKEQDKTFLPEQQPVGSSNTPSHREHVGSMHEPYIIPAEDHYYDSDSKPTTRGLITFIVGFFVTLPLTIVFLSAILGIFASVFALLIGLIVAGVVTLVAVVAAGSGASLIGIIFGITQLFSFPASGVYEIGLGIIVAGAVLFVSILIYNFSIRFIPWVIKLVARLFKYVFEKLKQLFFLIRKECYKL